MVHDSQSYTRFDIPFLSLRDHDTFKRVQTKRGLGSRLFFFLDLRSSSVPFLVSIRQHTPAYIRQHTSAYDLSAFVSIRQCTYTCSYHDMKKSCCTYLPYTYCHQGSISSFQEAYVSIRQVYVRYTSVIHTYYHQHTSAPVRTCNTIPLASSRTVFQQTSCVYQEPFTRSRIDHTSLSLHVPV